MALYQGNDPESDEDLRYISHCYMEKFVRASAILRFLRWAPPLFGLGFKGRVSQVQAASLSREVLSFNTFHNSRVKPAAGL